MNPLKSSERLDMNPPFHNLERASDDKDCIRTSICLIINNPWFGKALVIRVPSDDNLSVCHSRPCSAPNQRTPVCFEYPLDFSKIQINAYKTVPSFQFLNKKHPQGKDF